MGKSLQEDLPETTRKILVNVKPKLSNQRSNMALVEVNPPSGYVTEVGLIVENSGINLIQKKEILYAATTAVLYYENMGTEKNCFVISANRLFKVALNRLAFVKVYDYYNPGK